MIKGQAPKLPTGQQSEATRVRQSQPFAGAQGGVGGLPPPTRIPKDAWVLVVPALGNKSCGASLQRLSVHHAPDLGSRNMPTMVDPASQVLEPPPNPGRFKVIESQKVNGSLSSRKSVHRAVYLCSLFGFAATSHYTHQPKSCKHHCVGFWLRDGGGDLSAANLVVDVAKISCVRSNSQRVKSTLDTVAPIKRRSLTIAKCCSCSSWSSCIKNIRAGINNIACSIPQRVRI